MSQRIGYFGGSFDPPHNGHLAIAAAAAAHFRLDRVLFAPTGIQPLKPDGAAASFTDRLRMVELACASHSDFAPSGLDAPHTDGTPNYTVDALDQLHASLRPSPRPSPRPADGIFVLVGVDAFRHLRRWRDPDRLLTLAEWAVISRPGHPPAAAFFDELGLTPAQQARIHPLDGIEEPQSSTTIRAQLAAGQDCRSLLPAALLEYIHTHHLYGT